MMPLYPVRVAETRILPRYPIRPDHLYRWTGCLLAAVLVASGAVCGGLILRVILAVRWDLVQAAMEHAGRVR